MSETEKPWKRRTKEEIARDIREAIKELAKLKGEEENA